MGIPLNSLPNLKDFNAMLYPPLLPKPQVKAYKARFQAYSERIAVLGGRSRFKRVSAKTTEKYSLTFQFSQAQMNDFEQWWFADLADGTEPFTIGLLLPGGYSEQEVNFIGMYDYVLEGNSQLFIVGADVQRRI